MLISPMISSRRKAVNWPHPLGDLLVGHGFEILDQLLQRRQTRQLGYRRDLEALRHGEELRVARQLGQVAQPLETARCSLHLLDGLLLPLGVRNRPRVGAVSGSTQNLRVDRLA